jgi:SHAQKYF class myb-like DNA-binding protein
MFKTERIVLSKTKVVEQKNNNKDNELLKYRAHFAKNKPKRKIDSNPNMFLNKKRNIFHIYNSDEFLKNEINPSNSGRWTLNEHTTFLEALDKYGVNWKKIDSLIKTRTVNQIRSHGQKFYLRLKQVKDEQLGIDFTSNTINNLNDMINHIKSINSDYDIFKVLLYISDKYSANKKGKMLDIIKKKLNNRINKNSESYINNKNINNLQNYINTFYDKIKFSLDIFYLNI